MRRRQLDVALTLRGVTVYYIFKNNDPGQGHRAYWFSLNPRGCEAAGDQRAVDEFDVRDLDAADGVAFDGLHDIDTSLEVLIRAIEAGEIKPGMRVPGGRGDETGDAD